MDWLFPKDIHEITFEDLKKRLTDMPEGLYVEYKGPETIDDQATIAKEIAAFANTYGGWLFVGIEEDPENENKPKPDGWHGVAKNDADVDRIQQIASDHLSPGPYVAAAPVKLSEDDKDSDAILAIRVEESDDAPLIRRQDGRVYRRTGAISKPVDYVKDRAELDRLYDKGLRGREKVRQLAARHDNGRRLVEHQYQQYWKRKQALQHPRAYVYALCYPLTAGFRIDGLFARVERPIDVVLEASNSFQEFLHDGVQCTWWYPDQYTVSCLTSGGHEAVQVDSYGHFAKSTLLPQPVKGFNLDHVKSIASICSEVYAKYGYWGRVQLEFSLGRTLLQNEEPLRVSITVDAHLERVMAAAELRKLSIEKLKSEAARALGERDSP